jgi:hypothetical protein
VSRSVAAIATLVGCLSCGGIVVFDDEAGSSAGGGSSTSSTPTTTSSSDIASSVTTSADGASVQTSSGASSVAVSSAASTTAAGTGGGPVDPPPPPTALYVREGDCGFEAPVRDAMIELTRVPDSDDVVLVAELAFTDECTGAGGQHLLARAIDGSGMTWIGSHACYFFEWDLVGSGVHAGVVRVRPGQPQQISDQVCIEFPGVPGPPATDDDAMAVAVFASLEDAETFAAAVP